MAHHISRLVLAAEVIVLVLPVLAVALFLGMLFAAAWMPIALISVVTDPSFKKVFFVGSVWLTAAGSMVHLLSVSAVSVAYVRRGRTEIHKLSKSGRMLLFVGPLFPLACFFLASPPGGDAAFLMMLPGLLLLIPSGHLIAACWIADYWSSRSGKH